MVDSAIEEMGNHAFKFLVVIGVGFCDTLIGVEHDQFPSLPTIDVISVVVDLGGIAGELFLTISEKHGRRQLLEVLAFR